MDDPISAEFGGYEWQLFAAGAAVCESLDTMFVADLHLGKDATFRSHGIPVPKGATSKTLDKLSELIVNCGVAHLVVLGDMFHAKSSLTQDAIVAMDWFIQNHPSLSFTLVRGNHDKHAGELPKRWPIRIVEPGERIEKVVLGHEPVPVPSDANLLLCGHLHPAIRCASRQDSCGKLPCFWWNERRLVFPAFGEFTGTSVIQPSPKDRVWIIVQDEIMEHLQQAGIA